MDSIGMGTLLSEHASCDGRALWPHSLSASVAAPPDECAGCIDPDVFDSRDLLGSGDGGSLFRQDSWQRLHDSGGHALFTPPGSPGRAAHLPGGVPLTQGAAGAAAPRRLSVAEEVPPNLAMDEGVHTPAQSAQPAPQEAQQKLRCPSSPPLPGAAAREVARAFSRLRSSSGSSGGGPQARAAEGATSSERAAPGPAPASPTTGGDVEPSAARPDREAPPRGVAGAGTSCQGDPGPSGQEHERLTADLGSHTTDASPAELGQACAAGEGDSHASRGKLSRANSARASASAADQADRRSAKGKGRMHERRSSSRSGASGREVRREYQLAALPGVLSLSRLTRPNAPMRGQGRMPCFAIPEGCSAA